MRHAKRDDGSEYWSFPDVDESTDERTTDLSRAAHEGGKIFPDDWRYAFLHEALSALEDAADDELDDLRLEADIYTGELTDWLSSRGDRPGLCDDACEELGINEATMVERIQFGQDREKNEVLAAVRAHLEAEAEASEDEE